MIRLKYEFFHIPKSIQCLTDLTLGEKAVISYFCTIRNERNIYKPREKTIAKDLGISIKTVERALKTLHRKGFIIKRKQWELDTNRINNYIIKF